MRNHITLDANYGISNPSINLNNNEVLAKGFLLQLNYAFSRFYPFDYTSTKYYGSEFAGLTNISTDMNPSSKELIGIPIDLWKIEVGYRNGFLTDFSDFSTLLSHSSSIGFSRIDFPDIYNKENSFIKNYQAKYKFSTNWEAGILVQVYEPIFLKLSYEGQLLHNTLEYKYLYTSLSELFIQRLIDYLSYRLIEDDPKLVSVAHFILKNGLSLFLYENRKNASWFPFGGGETISLSTFKIGFSFIFNAYSRELK